MVVGRFFISTGPRRLRRGGWWHVLLAFHRRWRSDLVRVNAKPGYRRLYFGPVEIEWQYSPATNPASQSEGERETVARTLAKLKGHRDLDAEIILIGGKSCPVWRYYLDDADVILAALSGKEQG